MWSTWIVFVAVTGVAMAEPLAPCEKVGDRIADSDSCTRYHICREEEGKYNTDIAICPADKLFDVGEAICVARGTGYVPNPNSCTKFYGCQPPSNNKGEGLIRKTYECTGDLRFDPELGKCTYKVLVPDAKCNNGVSSQQILGQQSIPSSTSSEAGTQFSSSSASSSNSNSGDDNSSSSASTSSGGSNSSPSGSNTGNNPSSSASNSNSPSSPSSTSATDNNNPSSGNNPSSASNNPSTSNADNPSNNNNSPSIDTAGGQGAGTRLAGGVALPESEVSDLERIAQVIKGQLLNRNRGGSLLNKEAPASSRL